MEPAKKVFGQYKEIEFVGRGSLGVVYKVEKDAEVFALKKFEVNPETSERYKNEALQYFLHQGDILKNFDHPHILKYVERFELEGNHYLVTEFIDGATLGKHMKHMENDAVSALKKRIYFGQLMHTMM